MKDTEGHSFLSALERWIPFGVVNVIVAILIFTASPWCVGILALFDLLYFPLSRRLKKDGFRLFLGKQGLMIDVAARLERKFAETGLKSAGVDTDKESIQSFLAQGVNDQELAEKIFDLAYRSTMSAVAMKHGSGRLDEHLFRTKQFGAILDKIFHET
jgi:hypothetical protein